MPTTASARMFRFGLYGQVVYFASEVLKSNREDRTFSMTVVFVTGSKSDIKKIKHPDSNGKKSEIISLNSGAH